MSERLSASSTSSVTLLINSCRDDKIYENDERDKLLPISITTNFILRTSRAMF